MSDDESSDSSEDYLVPVDKIDLNSKFFSQPTSKNAKTSCSAADPMSSGVSSDDDFVEEETKDSAALLAEVMKNLEKANNISNPSSSTTDIGSTDGAKSVAKKSRESLANEIEDLLQGESGFGSLEADEDEDEQEKPAQEAPQEYTIPKEGIAITLPGTEMIFNRRKKRGVDLQELLVKKLNQRLRSNQLYIHKVGLLCWLAHGFHLNVQLNDCEVLAAAMSLVPQAICPDGRVDLKYLENFTKWFRKLINVKPTVENDEVTKDILLERIKEKSVHNHRELVLIYIATLRAIGLNCRLVLSLCAPPMKLRRDQLFPAPNKPNDNPDVKKEPEVKKGKEPQEKSKNNGKTKKTERQKGKKKLSPIKIIPENSHEGDIVAKENAKKKAVQVYLSKFSRSSKNTSIIDVHKNLEDTDDEGVFEKKSTGNVRQLRSKTVKKSESSKKRESSIERALEDAKKLQPSTSKVNSNKKPQLNLRKLPQRSSKKKTEENAKTDSDKSYIGTDSASESDSSADFSPPKKPKLTSKAAKSLSKSKVLTDSNSKFKAKPSTSRKSSIDRRVLSSDEEEKGTEVEQIDAKDSKNLWVEVYVESEESWISVSVPDGKIHCVNEIYKKIPRPVLYIVGWNSSGNIKDLTRRYCPNWLTDTRKQRVEEKWWKESLAPFAEKQTAMSRGEDEQLAQRELEQPLPKTLSECKGHPLYVVQRHLLKFEALYPPDCVPLGHLKTGDAIYSRHCVHILRSRESWHKEARVVKPSQEAYKIVKSMPKFDKFTGQKMKDLPLELFGMWQTVPYEPPEVKNGIIPRNEYGNVDLFKESMLPKGAVHIDLPALNRVAKKLNIDCAPACVGFNFGCRGALPAFEGFVVAEEYEDTLREAWEQEQIEARKRAKEKRDKRIWGNWRKLIRGLMIRERLAAKYEFNTNDDGEPSEPPTKRKVKETKKPVKKT